MKFRYPKHIVIGSTRFEIRYNKKSDGAEFCYPTDKEKAFIEFGLGVHKTNPLSFLNQIIHEFKEIIQVEQSARLWKRGNDSYVFMYDHSEHTDLCCQLAGVLSKFIK